MASSSSSSLSVPVLASQSWKYDVFLSFRGEDTRKTFVDHFYTALDRQGIHTYKDDVTLPRGESISPALLKAIEESQAAVIIFSKNYANSTWCLDELVHIMKCRVERNQTVLPIFYDVEPTEVRKQKGKYKEAFEKHELENKVKVETWRDALVEASNISGWEPKLIANGHEAQAIKQIVEEILKRLKVAISESNENLIGMWTRVQGLKSELKMEEGGVRMVGIWGLGGGGKTTLASSVYDAISSMYEGCFFIHNVREKSSSKNGLEELQEKIISGVLKQKEVQEGRMIKARLRRLKVLIVLDDVDHLDQLEALAGSRGWFGEGSRILITTRDEHLLNAHGVDVTHNISLLNHEEAIKLFRKHAHGDYTPMEDFEKLSEEVVFYAGGLPLALKVLGSFLCGSNISQWRSAIDKLKDIPHKDIIGILRISYDGLEQDEKELFLDIACFLRGWKKDKAMEKFHACGFHPIIGIEVLRHKSLIVITEYGRFDMHDLVQEMGHHIVRGEHPKNPEKHSRVWKKEDVRSILAMAAMTKFDNIEAMDLQFLSDEEKQRFLQVAGNMNKLRWIDLDCYGKRYEIAPPLPQNFPPREICFLSIFKSITQQQLWEGYKYLPNMRHMELVLLPNLIKIPDFSGLANLETFKLGGCLSLEEIHPSMGRLESLVFLSIGYCESLRKFPSITRIKKLETLQFIRCHKLEMMSEEEMEMEKLGRHVVVDLGNTSSSGKQQVAAASSSSSSSKKPARTKFFLNCWTCGSSSPPPVVEPYCLPHHRRLRFSHTALRQLQLSDCGLGDEEIGSGVWELPNLEQLDLINNPRITRLDFSNKRLPQLKRLDVSHCRGLVELSELPSSIVVVIADECSSLESFGDVSKCKWLWKVSLLGKNKLGQVRGDTLIESMLQGNATEDHFISVALHQHQLPNGLVGRLFSMGKTFRLQLPDDDWYNDFCGFLIRIVTNMSMPIINIKMMKQEDPPPFDLSQQQQQESDDDEAAVEPPPTIMDGEDMRTCVGYVSFGSLMRHTTFTSTSTFFTSSSHNTISFTVEDAGYHKGKTAYVGAELIPRKSKSDDDVQTTTTTHSSEFFWDEKSNTFTIQQHRDSKSSIEITWRPYNRFLQPRQTHNTNRLIDYALVRSSHSQPFGLY